jgi:hypothetical protein
MAFRHHIPRKKNAHLLRSLITITVYVNWRLRQTHFLERYLTLDTTIGKGQG